jgi:signal peptidase I
MNPQSPDAPKPAPDTPTVSTAQPSTPVPAPPTTENEIQPGLTPPTLPEESPEEEKREGIRSILSTIAILIIAPVIALLLTAFVFQSYEVDGPSMETTLQNRDRLIVYKLPKTIARLTGHQYLPNRGDIVIFNRRDSLEFGTDSTRQLIKRVIALPGERLVVKDGRITVYNQAHPAGFHPDDAPYGKVITTTAGDIDLTVPQNQIFVCGDNRPQSLDSRSFGPVPTSDLVGKLILRLYPFSKAHVY